MSNVTTKYSTEAFCLNQLQRMCLNSSTKAHQEEQSA